MKKHIKDEQTGISYTLHGDYYYELASNKVPGHPSEIFDFVDGSGSYLPDCSLSAEEEIPIGEWGQRHAAFLKKYQRSVYNELLVSGKLQRYFAQIDRDAQEMFDLLVRQLAAQECVTEQLKAEDQMEWVGQMNNIRNRATEIVNHELIYA